MTTEKVCRRGHVHSDKYHCLECRRERYKAAHPRKTTGERFWEKVDLSGDCWEWRGAIQKHYGHGTFWNGERVELAHRFSWRLFFGSIPDGMEICHHCDNPACVRPEHLFLGTHADNMRDMGRKMRRAEKLTREDIIFIRQSDATRADLARKFGVSRSLIIHILQRKIYRDIVLVFCESVWSMALSLVAAFTGAPARLALSITEGLRMKTWICDIDGTLALKGERSPFDWSRVGEDLPNAPVIRVVEALLFRGDDIVFMSGRMEQCRRDTTLWLKANIDYCTGEPLFMRADDDYRPDTVVKRELFDNHVKDRYDVIGVIDDRYSVVRQWRSMGLTCLQVAEGNF